MKVVIFCALMEDIWRPPDPIVAEIPATVHQLSMAAWRRTLSHIYCRPSKMSRQSSSSVEPVGHGHRRPEMGRELVGGGPGIEPTGGRHHVDRTAAQARILQTGTGPRIGCRPPPTQSHQAHSFRLQPLHQSLEPTETTAVLVGGHFVGGTGGPFDQIGHADAFGSENVGGVTIPGAQTAG